MSDFSDPPSFNPGDSLEKMREKAQQLRAVVQRIIGTQGPNKGMTAWAADGSGGGGAGGTTIIDGGSGSGSGPVDLTPPPTPTGFGASAAISHLIITCANQTYTQGGGHLYSRVYGAIYDPTIGGPFPTFSDAVLIDTFPGTVQAIPENPSTEWHLWLKWVTHALVESVSPAGGTNGVVATTGQDVSKLVEALTGAITESQLYSALATRINLIDGSSAIPGSVNARVAAEATSRASADSALATSISTVAASTATNASAITSESTARASADTALGTRIDTVVAVSNGLLTAVTNLCLNPGFVPGSGGWNSGIAFVARTAAGVPPNAPSDYVGNWAGRDGFMTAAIPVTPGEILDCSVWVASASATTNRVGLIAYAYDSGGSIIAFPLLTAAQSGVTGWVQLTGSYTATAGVVRVIPVLWIEQATSGGPDRAYYAQPTVMRRAGSAIQSIAAVQTETTARTSADSALASSITTLTASVGANTTAISSEATARASADGQLFSQYTVKIDSNGYVSGFGLASTSNSGTPISGFIVRADDFAIASPSGPGIAPTTPFIVRTTPTTINGVVVPVGIYMTDTYIQNGTITNAKIGNLAVDDAKIASASVAKLTAGSLQVGAYIRSTSFVTGSSGWTIEANGTAEFAAASIRGTLVASQIGAGTIDASKLNVTSLSAITANIGTLRTASSGQRLEISDNRIRVFDSANVLRVKIGDLS